MTGFLSTTPVNKWLGSTHDHQTFLMPWFLILTVFFLLHPTRLNAGVSVTPVNVDGFVKVALNKLSVGKLDVYSARITNISQQVINAPLSLVITDISNNKVKLFYSSGNTSTGQPYVTVPLLTGSLKPGKTAITLLTFIKTNKSDTYTFKISVLGILPSINLPPIANAGSNQPVVVVGNTVQLDGSGSSDADGNALTYTWKLTTIPANSVTTLINPNSVNPSFMADRPGTYIAQLIVNDGTVNSDPASVTITTQNSPPVANAGPDQTVLAMGQMVQLDGSGSSDADGDALTFNWTLSSPSNSNATLTEPGSVQSTFVVDQPGTYTAQLVVNDGSADSAPSTVTIITNIVANSPPVVNVSAPQGVTLGQTVVLDGTRTTDPDGDLLYYQWSVTGPDGSGVGLSDPYSPRPTFKPDVIGIYMARLSVYDGTVDRDASIEIEVTKGLPRKPTIISINRVNQTQIDDQTVEDAYTAEVQNDRHDRTKMEAVIISAPSSVEIIKGNLTFGDISAGGTRTSIDSFTLRHTPEATVTSDSLGWNVFSNPVPPDIFPQVGGITMPGDQAQAAIDAYLDYRDAGRYQDTDISYDVDGNSVLRTVIDVEIDLNATVADVRNLLQSVNGRIVEMTEGANWIGLLIPDPGTLDVLNGIVTNIESSPAVATAVPRYLPVDKQLPNSVLLTPDATKPDFMTQPETAHHLAVKGPAAWNARAALDYATSCIPFLVVYDAFGDGLSGGVPPFPGDVIPNTGMIVLNPSDLDGSRSTKGNHGYSVSGVLAGLFSDTLGLSYSFRDQVVGMFPRSTIEQGLPTVLLDRTVNIYQNTSSSGAISSAIKDIENNSYFLTGYTDECPNGLPRRIVVNHSQGLNYPNAAQAIEEARKWSAEIRGNPALNYQREDNFSMFAAAGNESTSASKIPAMDEGGIQRLGLSHIQPQPGDSGHVKVNNTAVVENRRANNSRNGYAPEQELSAFSNVGGNISAIGVLEPSLRSSHCVPPPPQVLDRRANIFSFTGLQIDEVGCDYGTSMATPQVAGLGAYLWALRPNWTSKTLLDHIINNAERTVRDDPGNTTLQGAPVIDAYATILSADQANNSMSAADFRKQSPARTAILDVYEDSVQAVADKKFDLNDVKMFVEKLFPPDPNNSQRLAPNPTKPDYSRFDLNGDGYTGGDNQARFNLDMDYDQNGGAIYSRVGVYDENKVTDFGILCYYVQTKLFQTTEGAGVSEFEQYLQARSDQFGQTISCPAINDTGITACSDGLNQASYPCPVAGGPGQDAEYGRDKTHNNDGDGHAGFSFTKIAADGNRLPADASSWSCVRDNVTGLIWEVKTADGGLHDKTKTYTNFSLVYSSAPGHPEYGGYGGPTDATGFVIAVNNEGLCGAKDWRLPTVDELQNIVDYSVAPPGPTIDQRFFPNAEAQVGDLYNIYNVYYWSSEPFLGRDGGFYPDIPNAWTVDFSSGLIGSADRWPGGSSLVSGVSVRLVRAAR